MTVFQDGNDMFFDAGLFDVDAVYRPGGVGAAVACRVILRQPDEMGGFGETQIVRGSTLVDVRVTEVAAPREGDSFTLGATVYEVTGAPRRDADRLVWTCVCRGSAFA